MKKDTIRTEWNEERHHGVVGRGQNGMKKDIMDRWPRTELNEEGHHGVVGQGQNGVEVSACANVEEPTAAENHHSRKPVEILAVLGIN